MAELSRAKSIQLILTGILLVLFSCGLFGLLYIIHDDGYDFGKSDIFNRKTSFWVAIPITITGLVGVLAGITTKTALVTLYLISCLVSTGLAGLVSVVYGLRVNNIRAGCGDDSTCKNSDTAVLIGTIILLSALLLTISLLAAVKACQAKWGPSKNKRKKQVIYAAQYKGNTPSVPVLVIDKVRDGNVCHACGRANLVAETESDIRQENGSTSGYDSTNETNHAYESLQPTLTVKHDGNQPDRTAEDDGVPQCDNSAKDDGTPSYQALEDHRISQSDKTEKDDGTCPDKTEGDHGISQSDTTTKDDGTSQVHNPPKNDGNSAYYVSIIDGPTQSDTTPKDDCTSQAHNPPKDDGSSTYYESMDGQADKSPDYEPLDAKTRNQSDYDDVEANEAVQVNEAFEDDDTAF